MPTMTTETRASPINVEKSPCQELKSRLRIGNLLRYFASVCKAHRWDRETNLSDF